MDINKFYNTLDEIYSSKESFRAESYMQNCLEDARFDGDYGALILICNELGGYYRAVGKHQEAVPLYLLALDCIKKLNMTGTENHATTLINQGTNYAVWGKPEEALSIFREAKEMLDALGLNVDFRVATLHNNMSILMQDMNDYKGALKELNMALEILLQLDDTDIEVATTYTNMAQIKYEMGNYHEALVDVNNALKTYDKTDASEDVHYSAVLEIYAHIHRALGDIEKARKGYQDALSLAERDYGKDSSSYKALYELLEELE